MRETVVDLLARAFGASGSRRRALAIAGAMLMARIRLQPAGGETLTSGGRRAGAAFSSNMQAIRHHSAGPNRNEEFQHIDDNLLIEIISKGRRRHQDRLERQQQWSKRAERRSLEGASIYRSGWRPGAHRRPQRSRRGLRVGRDLASLCRGSWRARSSSLTASRPEECQSDANRIGVFFETTVRIKNK